MKLSIFLLFSLLFLLAVSAVPKKEESADAQLLTVTSGTELSEKASVASTSCSTSFCRRESCCPGYFCVNGAFCRTCSTNFCGRNHAPCCDGYFCVNGAFCRTCSTNFCGRNHAPCCDGYFCVNGAFCRTCSTNFCGRNHAPCCDGYYCENGAFCRRRH